MAYKIIVTEAALFDFEDAMTFYEQQKTGLGLEFATFVQLAYQKIASNPTAFQRINNEIRHYVVKRFPYAIYYKVATKAEIVYILAVFHTSRNPNIWITRK